MDSFWGGGLIYADYNKTILNEPELDPGLVSLCTLEAVKTRTGCICVCLKPHQLLNTLNS